MENEESNDHAIEINASRFNRVTYEALNAKQKAIYNFQKIAATFADYGFNCIKLADDWMGADFLAYHKNSTNTLKVQLKGRPTIDKKYIGKGIHIAFPLGGYWYLSGHDKLVEIVGKHTNWLNTPSWLEAGAYNAGGLGPAFLESLSEHRLGPIYKPS
jgi:hypothetical protein